MADDRERLSLRLDPQLANKLRAIAGVTGRSMNELCSQAVAELVETYTTDPEFREDYRQWVQERREQIDALNILDDQ